MESESHVNHISDLLRTPVNNQNVVLSSRDFLNVNSALHQKRMLSIAKITQDKFLLTDVSDDHYFKKQNFHLGHSGMVINI